MSEAGQSVVLRPQGMSYRGTAVARLDGQAIFVGGALPGEQVVAQISRQHRDFLEAETVDVIEPSPARVSPRCAHFGLTGSCEWEFIAYEEQLRLKDEILRDQFRRVGHFREVETLPPVPSPREWGYRNHVHFAIDAYGNPVYLRRSSHIPVPIQECAVLDPSIDAALPHLQGRLRGLASVELRHGTNTGESLIAPSLESRHVELPSGQADYHEVLLGRRFQVSAGSFFQVNTGVAEELASLLLSDLELRGTDRLADLYAGVGTFACLLSPKVGAVVAIESSPAAVDDGRLNSGFLENVRYRKGDVSEVFPRIQPEPHIVVLDPPRSGCDRAVLRALVAASPRQIAYVSCDAATLARDARALTDGGYELGSVRVIDMFPQTYHIEALAILNRASAR